VMLFGWEGNCGPGGKNDSLPSGLCGLTAKRLGLALSPVLINPISDYFSSVHATCLQFLILSHCYVVIILSACARQAQLDRCSESVKSFIRLTRTAI